jgi:hypothetical protein
MALVIVVQGLVVLDLNKKVKENEELMYKIADIVIKKEMKESMDNLHKGLENLFNPKDEPKNNVKKTRTNSKTK